MTAVLRTKKPTKMLQALTCSEDINFVSAAHNFGCNGSDSKCSVARNVYLRAKRVVPVESLLNLGFVKEEMRQDALIHAAMFLACQDNIKKGFSTPLEELEAHLRIPAAVADGLLRAVLTAVQHKIEVGVDEVNLMRAWVPT